MLSGRLELHHDEGRPTEIPTAVMGRYTVSRYQTLFKPYYPTGRNLVTYHEATVLYST